MGKFTNMDYRRALMLFMDEVSVTDIAEQMNTSRVSITNWKKKGLPVEITGGVTWEEFRDTDRANQMREYIARQADEATSSSLEFFENAKRDVELLFNNARERLLSGGGKVQFSDVEKLLNIFIRLDNQAADRVLWMQDVMTKVIRVIANRVTDERLLLQVRNDLIAIAANEQKKLGPIPGAVELPLPSDIGAVVVTPS